MRFPRFYAVRRGRIGKRLTTSTEQNVTDGDDMNDFSDWQNQGRLTDEGLVLACREGDETAWEELIRRYERLVYSIPRRAGLDADQAADVFQQVFATLVRQLERIERPDRIQAWLVTIAKRETFRMLRGDGKFEFSPSNDNDVNDPLCDVADPNPLPDAELIKMQQVHLIRTGLEMIDERCRRLLTMLYFTPEPPSYSEIAAELQTSAGSVGPTRARCLQKLQKILDELGL
jgi:RNA polymerase sigma factor (sigma-70 family)